MIVSNMKSHLFCTSFIAVSHEPLTFPYSRKPEQVAVVKHLSVAAHADPSLRYISMLLGHELVSKGSPKISVTTGTLLYVFGSYERHSELTEEMSMPLRSIPKTLSVVDVSFNWATIRKWQTKVLDTWRDCLVGLVVKASRAEDPGFDSRLRRDISWVESYQ